MKQLCTSHSAGCAACTFESVPTCGATVVRTLLIRQYIQEHQFVLKAICIQRETVIYCLYFHACLILATCPQDLRPAFRISNLHMHKPKCYKCCTSHQSAAATSVAEVRPVQYSSNNKLSSCCPGPQSLKCGGRAAMFAGMICNAQHWQALPAPLYECTGHWRDHTMTIALLITLTVNLLSILTNTFTHRYRDWEICILTLRWSASAWTPAD